MIALIAAVGKNLELGKNNDLIWRIPSDLKFFKETTLNHTVIMGYKTFLSIGRVLPSRRNVVLTSHEIDNEEVFVYDNIDELIKNEIKDEEVFIIGGYSLYKYFYDFADEIYLTEIDAEDPEADVYFPAINHDEWDRVVLGEGTDNNLSYQRVLYRRISNE